MQGKEKTVEGRERIIERKVQVIGSSFLITLPKSWTKTLGVKKGSTLKMLVTESGTLTLVPDFIPEARHHEVTFQYDENFNRRFFKEYFAGNERITLLLEKRVAQAERKNLQEFLRRFMNLQVIEETGKKIVVKCFRIDQLSMQECLNRMHFLSLNMLEESGDTEMQDLRDTMTRFYYLLVMQVRRFLSEGTYTDANQIPLIKAMDIRMVAEKVQRIGEAAEKLRSYHLSKGALNFKERLLAYYRSSFQYFMNDDFEKANPLWVVGNALQRDGELLLSRLRNDQRDAMLELLKILRAAKEVSMLVR
jgi:phosphate uptake regulator